MISNLGKWDYSGVGNVCYSDPECVSYKKAVEFLGKDNPVEDWGGGTGWAKRYFTGEYKNIDGSRHKNVDMIADLVDYTSSVENILMRQVLGSNPEWQKILTNVRKSFTKKFCLVVCTPFVDKTRLGSQNPVVRSDNTTVDGEYIQEVFFKKQDILDFFPINEFRVNEETIQTNQYYNQDWILYVEKIT